MLERLQKLLQIAVADNDANSNAGSTERTEAKSEGNDPNGVCALISQCV